MSEINCNGKHTSFQPAENQFKCPKCGAESGNFYIDESGDGAHEECILLHIDDFCACTQCGYSASGAVVARALAKAGHVGMVKCSCCKGTGWVKA